MARPPAIGKTARKARRSLLQELTTTGEGPDDLAAPGPNPATSRLIADVAVRGAGIVFRHAIEQILLRARFTPEEAEDIAEGRGRGRSLVSRTAARVATRSVPGFLAVAGGLAAKAVIDRGLAQGKSRRAGDKPRKRKGRRGDGA